MDVGGKMTLTADQFLSLSIAMIIGITVAWTAVFLSLRSQPRVLLALFADGLFLRMLTVVFIICAASALAMIDQLSAEVTAILAGIAGYVLGSARTQRYGDRTNNHENSGEKRETDSMP
jgi:hypothetical protein